MIYDSNGNRIKTSGGIYYNCTEYGVKPSNSDNTLRMQLLINKVHDSGGGIIYIPVGEYRFNSANNQQIITGEAVTNPKCILQAKSNVSILGENMVKTVLKVYGNTEKGATLFGYNDYNDPAVPIDGCTYENFTVDASEATINTYSSDGKAFFYQYVTNSVWRDLRLLGTPATSLGIDYLDNVLIDNVYCYRSGRASTDGSPGGAGIGIGTGAWEQERFTICNCVTEECGRFGIFWEDQGLFSNPRKALYSEGHNIHNCKCYNGRADGLGIRGGCYGKISDCVSYNNAYNGLMIDYQAKECLITNNIFAENGKSGIAFESTNIGLYPFTNLNFSLIGNVCTGNVYGIKVEHQTTGLALLENRIQRNTTSDIRFSNKQYDVIAKNNIYDSVDKTSVAWNGDNSRCEMYTG